MSTFGHFLLLLAVPPTMAVSLTPHSPGAVAEPHMAHLAPKSEPIHNDRETLLHVGATLPSKSLKVSENTKPKQSPKVELKTKADELAKTNDKAPKKHSKAGHKEAAHKEAAHKEAAHKELLRVNDHESLFSNHPVVVDKPASENTSELAQGRGTTGYEEAAKKNEQEQGAVVDSHGGIATQDLIVVCSTIAAVIFGIVLCACGLRMCCVPSA